MIANRVRPILDGARGWATCCAVLLAVLAPGLCGAATLTVSFTNNGQPLEDPSRGKFYVYEPEQRAQYVAWGHGERPASFPDGTYDIVIRYRNDQIVEERVLERQELEGDVEQEVALSLSIARLTVDITSGGDPIESATGKYSVYAATRRGKPLARKRPGSTLTIREGYYDIEVSFRGSRGLKTRWLENYYLSGERRETVEMGVAPARFQLTLLEDGRPLDARQARWRIYRRGLRTDYLAERGSGEWIEIERGTYDIGLFYGDSRDAVKRWLYAVEMRGELKREVDIAREPTSLSVRITRRGARTRDSWFSVYPAGNREGSVGGGPGGSSVEIDSGSYDIGCFLRSGGVRAEKWLRGRDVSGRETLDCDLDVDVGSLRVNLPRRWKGEDPRRPTVLLLLDSSADMQTDLGPWTRMELARRTLADVVGEFEDAGVDIGLRVFGIAPRAQQDCTDSTLIVPPSSTNGSRLSTTLDLMRPSGYSPIAGTLDQVRSDVGPDAMTTVVLLAGSVENCRGNPCATAASLLRDGTVERSFVVGLGLEADRRRALECVGDFSNVSTEAAARNAVRRAFRTALAGDRGTVSLFDSRDGSWVVSGAIGEKLEVALGTYDVLIRIPGAEYRWDGVEISRDLEAVAGARPKFKR